MDISCNHRHVIITLRIWEENFHQNLNFANSLMANLLNFNSLNS